jgi:antitoxin component of MazEF toxin-antitoxin module
MIVSLTQVGDSMSIKIPQAILQQCESHDECKLYYTANSKLF